jgi:predicted  nucleic acid-binding Zn-ribbon protein
LVDSNQMNGINDLEIKFQVLETKVIQAIKKIEVLKQEKTAISQQFQEAQNRIITLEKKLSEAEDRLVEVEECKRQVQELTRLKEMVAGKIAGLLEQMDNLPLYDL